MNDPSDTNDATPRASGGRLHRLLLGSLVALSSLAATCIVLEAGARLLGPDDAPILLRDGIYESVLPLVNGRVTATPPVSEPVVRLPVAKATGEVRVFVFGESSVEGSPWGHDASPPAMLYDLLARDAAARTLRVVNMGRSSSFTMDTYYYMLSIIKYAPDFIIIYQGTNDRYDIGGEVCWPETAPTLHTIWRMLASTSRLLQIARIYGPTYLRDSTNGRTWPMMEPSHPSQCDALAAWADILVETATESGAQVIVTSPVWGALHVLEGSPGNPHLAGGPAANLAALSAPYRDVLSCQLRPGCDLAAEVRAAKWDEFGPLARPLLAAQRALAGSLPDSIATAIGAAPTAVSDEDDWLLTGESSIWRATAERHGATFIDFERSLREASPSGLLLDSMVVDGVHLTLEGYQFLAMHWLVAVRARLGDGSTPPPRFPGRSDIERYERRRGDVTGSFGVMLYHLAFYYVRAGQFLLGASILETARGRYGDQDAIVALAWLRRHLGIDEALSPELHRRVESFDASTWGEPNPR